MKFRISIPLKKDEDIDNIINKVKKNQNVEDIKCENNVLIVDSSIKITEKEILDLIDEKKENIKTDVFYFDNIDCPNCANKVEVALNKSPLIEEANVVFLSNKIIVKHNENNIFEEVKRIVNTIEKDTNLFVNKDDIKVSVSSNDKEHHHKHHHDHHHEACECGEHHHDHECCSHEHHEECCCNHNHEHKENDEHNHIEKNRNTKDFVRKLIFIIGCILFGVATILLVLGNEEILSILNIDLILSGNGYFIPLFVLFITSYLLLSYDLIYKSIYGILHKDYFNESLLMVIASLGAIVLSFIGDIELFEACAVVLLYKIGESLQDKATEKSKDAIKGLLDIEVNEVTLKDGSIKNIDDVKVGDIIVIKAGEKIALDGILVSSSTSLDMKALTGESEPVYRNEGEEILSGSLNLTNVVEVEVTKENNESTISKVKKIVEEANSKKSKSEQFITKFARIYTPIVLAIAAIVLIVQLILEVNAQDALNNVFSILVISCPCSLVISIPLAYFASLGNASKNGVLVKGGNYLEALTSVEKIIVDKTGTITKGEFDIVEVVPNNVSKEELLNIAAMVESFSSHPIAKSIKKASQKDFELNDALIEEIAGNGLKMILNDSIYLVGNERLMKQNDVPYIQNESIGSVVYVSKNRNFLGSIVIRDQIKNNAKETIDELHIMNIDTLMLTGDKKIFGEFVANQVGIKEVYSELLPQEKYQIVDRLIDNKKRNIVYVGDGINDTPSLRRSDVGIALGGIGSDLAKETADIVIMNDDISKIKDVISLSKYTKKVIVQNVIFILLTKLIAIGISMSGVLESYAMLVAIFADVGVCLLCILNSLRILSFKNKTK